MSPAKSPRRVVLLTKVPAIAAPQTTHLAENQRGHRAQSVIPKIAISRIMARTAGPPVSSGDPSPSSELANSTEKLKINDAPDATDEIEHATRDGLDGVVTGGCSTCGSSNHDTVKCEHKDDAATEFMMSGALQPDMECSTPACGTGSSSTTAPAAQGIQANSGKRRSQATGRRYSA